MSKAWPVKGLDPLTSLEFNARRILRVRVAEYFAYEPIVNEPTATIHLHDLRISAKRLRYTLELFRSVFGEIGERNISRVKDIQEALGHLHDCDVRIDLILSELNGLAFEQNQELGNTLAGATSSVQTSLITSALRPPPDDPRRGLLTLLGREHAARNEHFLVFNRLWHRHHDDGLRSELVALSRTTLTS
ncbi:hypothetical protein BH23CHL5_BH23CHL5_19810 [soil metagenome]